MDSLKLFYFAIFVEIKFRGLDVSKYKIILAVQIHFSELVSNFASMTHLKAKSAIILTKVTGHLLSYIASSSLLARYL